GIKGSSGSNLVLLSRDRCRMRCMRQLRTEAARFSRSGFGRSHRLRRKTRICSNLRSTQGGYEMKLTAKILSMLIAGLLLVLPAYAQTGQGIINGKVTGRDGMPAPNMVIYVQRMNSQNANQRIVAQTFDTKTGRNGAYSVNGLPPGSYQVILAENGKQIMIL